MASDTRQDKIVTNDIKMVKYQREHGLLLKIRNDCSRALRKGHYFSDLISLSSQSSYPIGEPEEKTLDSNEWCSNRD